MAASGSELKPQQSPDGLKIRPEVIERQLPALLLSALERRWLPEVFRDHSIQTDAAAVTVDDVQRHTRLVKINAVAADANRLDSLSPRHMQSAIGGLGDGSHSLVYALAAQGPQLSLMMGVRRLPGPHVVDTDGHMGALKRSLRSHYPGLDLADLYYEDYYPSLLAPFEQQKNLGGLVGIPSFKGPLFGPDAVAQSIDRLADGLRGETYTLLVLAEPIIEDWLIEYVAGLRRLSGEIHAVVRQSQSISRSRSDATAKTDSQTRSVTLGTGSLLSTLFSAAIGQQVTRGETISVQQGEAASLSIERLDKTAEFCEQTLDHHLARVQSGRGLGFWNVGVYLTSPDGSTYRRAQSLLRGLYAGQHTHFEPLQFLSLAQGSRDVRQSITRLRVPVFKAPGGLPSGPKWHPLGHHFQSLGTPLTTEEVTVLVALPGREVPGLKLTPAADFNVNPPLAGDVKLGHLIYRGEKLSTPILLSSPSLTRHTLVTGVTGSGKTNTCLALLAHAHAGLGLNFLVIDPAKTEYRFLLNAPVLKDRLRIFTLGDERAAPFRLNPFEFEANFPLLTHIDLLKAVFNSAFPMYASMPYLLEEAIISVYELRGWDLAESTNRNLPADAPEADRLALLPRLSDLYHQIDVIVSRKRYGAQLTQDLSAALRARLGSLLQGGKGLMLDTPRSIPLATLLETPVVLELRGIGDDDEKAFVMALLLVRLYEACRDRPLGQGLRHLTLVEEAHRLLRHVPTAMSAEVANPRGKAVEMFADMLAEMRAYGEGFVIVDQMPSKLVSDVIKGSNLKIVHRLLAQDDRVAVGQAMGLTATQIDFLPRLRIGEAVVHNEDLGEACLVKIDEAEDSFAAGVSVDEGLLRDRMNGFFAGRPELLWRQVGCTWCDRPCTYQPRRNQPSEPALAAADRYLTALTVGTGAALVATWQAVQALLQHGLAVAFPTGWQPGHARCARVLLAAEAVRRWSLGLDSRLDWAARRQLEVSLAKTWEAETPAAVELNALRELIVGKLALGPASSRAGCTACPARCWFGASLQHSDLPAIPRLASQLRSLEPGQTLSVEKLSGFAVEALGVEVQKNLRPAAAYCLLTQTTEDETLLRSFRRKAWPGAA